MAAALIIVVSALVFSGCGNNETAETSDSGSSSSSVSSNVYQTEYGQFEIPSGWVKNDEHSTDDKPFFVPESYDGNGVPDNISVEYGTNHYTKEQGAEFGRAILRQLNSQVGSELNGSITSSGSTTEAGDPLLTFNIPLQDRNCTQYYIMGDQCYVMVYETNIDDSASCDSAARKIVNSFEWK